MCIRDRINKIDKPLSRFIKEKRERTQINKIRIEREEITTDTTEIQRIVRNYYGVQATMEGGGNGWVGGSGGV